MHADCYCRSMEFFCGELDSSEKLLYRILFSSKEVSVSVGGVCVSYGPELESLSP